MKGGIVLFLFLALMTTGLQAQEAPTVQPGAATLQLYNLNFDNWSKSRKKWCPYAKDCKESDRVWDTANQALSLLGINGAEPEDEIVAVKGPGKRAAKLHSVKVLWAFAAGALYTGQFVRIVDWSGAEITMGVPFTGRPKSLDGYYYYIPQPINNAKPPYKALKGQMDCGQIEVLLTDWDAPFHAISNNSQYIDKEHDPHIIGHSYRLIREGTNGYVHFSMPLIYRNNRAPKWVVITTASSRYGDYYTGGDGSTLYIDEFQFKY